MQISDLLLAMLRVAMKARDVARIIRSEQTLLDLLVEEKKGAEKNKRFMKDFKTLADVLIQQMVSHDLVQEFPEMSGSIYGEESNQFTNTLGETTTVCLCATPDLTKQLLMDILDGNEEAATLLSEVVHREAAALPTVGQLGQSEINASDVGIWIDPIDSTAQYIRGSVGEPSVDGVTDGDLQCVAVLIGAFQKSTGLPIVGVAVQPFWELDPATQHWKDQTTWGVCYQDVQLASVLKNDASDSTKKPVIVMSMSESDAVKKTLNSFQICFAHGAGYKLLCTAQRRVDAYVLSKSSIYLWDCCAPHAILRATGGGVVCFHDTVSQAKAADGGNVLASDWKAQEVNYCLDRSNSGVRANSINGIIAYSCPSILERIVQSLVK